MPLTRNFKETVKRRADNDPEFRKALIVEALNAMLEGDIDIGKSLLRDYVNATVGFNGLAKSLGGDRDPKSFMRMLSSKGNPRTASLFEIIRFCQQNEGFTLAITSPAPQKKQRVKRSREMA